MNEEFENAKFRSLFKNRVFVKKFAIVLALFTAQVFSGTKARLQYRVCLNLRPFKAFPFFSNLWLQMKVHIN